MGFYKSVSKQVGKGEAEDLMSTDWKIKIHEKLLFKGHVRKLFAITVEKN